MMTHPESEAPASFVAVIPAAGIGSRMQAAVPKQYLMLHGKTLLEHTVAVLLQNPRIRNVVLALHPQDCWFADLPLAKEPRVSVVTGGENRADSVLAALQALSLPAEQWVLVHDAARPCLTQTDLNRLLDLTLQPDTIGGLLAAPVRDTMKRSNADGLIEQTVERRQLWHALTPQMFPLGLLRASLQQALQDGAEITDEASALEYCGYHPQLVTGRADNLKVTQPEDLALADFFLSQRLSGADAQPS